MAMSKHAAAVAKVTKAIHQAASALPQPKSSVQTITLTPTGGSKTAMQAMTGKINTPVQPSYYVAVIIPVYSDS
jgi:hypothetical protein